MQRHQYQPLHPCPCAEIRPDAREGIGAASKGKDQSQDNARGVIAALRLRIERRERPGQRIENCCLRIFRRSEEHTSELQSLMRTSYAVFCLKKKTINQS